MSPTEDTTEYEFCLTQNQYMGEIPLNQQLIIKSLLEARCSTNDENGTHGKT